MISATPPAEIKTLADAYREALRLDDAGRYAEARALCRAILRQSDGHAEVYHLLGVIALHERQPDEAAEHLRHALKLKPDLAEAALHLSIVYRKQERWREWLGALDTVHALQPHRADIVADMGYAHDMLREPGRAFARYQQALALDPKVVIAHANLAAAMIRRGAFAEAERHLMEVLAIQPQNPLALMNMAMLHDGLGHREEAIAVYDRVLQMDPDHVYAQFQRSLTLMGQGRLAEGWAAYTCRFRRPESRTLHGAFALPYWHGEPLAGRKLLIWTEQGPGDEILLASMIPDVLARGAVVSIVCSARMTPLFARSFPACAVISNTQMDTLGPGSFDAQASFSELGLYFRPDLDSFPTARRHLTADPALSRQLRGAYQDGTGDKLVGIAWHSANPAAHEQKSIALDTWGPILELSGVRFVNLQYGKRREDAINVRDAAGRGVIFDDTVDPLHDLDRFAAQVAAMDHVVSVSNTTVHVAGALGVPTSTLVPSAFGRIWYWFLDRSDSPWYPSMTLYRQNTVGDWALALAAVARDVRRTLGVTT